MLRVGYERKAYKKQYNNLIRHKNVLISIIGGKIEGERAGENLDEVINIKYVKKLRSYSIRNLKLGL